MYIPNAAPAQKRALVAPKMDAVWSLLAAKHLSHISVKGSTDMLTIEARIKVETGSPIEVPKTAWGIP